MFGSAVFQDITNDGIKDVFITGREAQFYARSLCLSSSQCCCTCVISLKTQPDEEKGKLTWTGLEIFSTKELSVFVKTLLFSLAIYATLATLVVMQTLTPVNAAWIGSLWTFGCFFLSASSKAKTSGISVFAEDRFWAGGLAGSAIFMLFFFF
mgnify:CR=1 FL=1